MNRVMIATLLFNRQPCTKACLESLFNYTAEPFDLFLWDNGSEKPTQELLDKVEGLEFANRTTITVIRNGENVGISDSLAALQEMRQPGQHWMKLDNDVIVPKDPMWLTDMLDILESNDAGLQVIGYPPHPDGFFFTYEPFVRAKIGLAQPLTSNGMDEVFVYRSESILGWLFLASSDFMDEFKYPSNVKKYGEGCDAALSAFASTNLVPMAYIHPVSMAGSANSMLACKQCAEADEYQEWKMQMLATASRAEGWDFRPSTVGNDSTALKIRADLLI